MTEKSSLSHTVRPPTAVESFSCFAFLIGAIFFGIVIHGVSIGIIMVLATVVALIVGYRCGYQWKDIEQGIEQGIGDVIPVLTIVLGIGFTIATWMFSGTIPVSIYYLLSIVNPDYIVAFAFIACSATAVAIGTSWGTAGTIGVVMIGMGEIAGVHMPLLAGAVVAGSMFGQIFSPMSDMCNLASSINKISTYNTLKGTSYIVFPVTIISIVAYLFLGMSYNEEVATTTLSNNFSEQVEALFNVNPLAVLPLIILMGCAIKRLPVVPSMFGAGFLAIAIGVGLNGFSVIDGLKASWGGFSVDMIPASKDMIVSDQIRSLVGRGGIDSMAWMFTLMFCAMMFIGIFSKIGCLNVIVETLFGNMKKKSSLVFASVSATLVTAIATTESYISVIVPTELFKEKFKNAGLPRVSLSTATLSASAIFIPLIPWGSTGIYMSGVTGVSIMQLAPFAFFCWMPAIMTIVFGFLNFGAKDENEQLELAEEK
ncbi:hypothetical protein BIY21_20515 [Vibrio ponticus]|uniref:Na+/H+ antiporter NhaC-like C-terminal domain-containing protein n=1 Tax=Vibrio ponticus TaxID=265668 RepID=A0ABX3FNL9_9VIBR|nr:Na+/H+ antiporter NhaC family protein [Vibrio ponticus]OLQ95809.1 hypothetical protein BIY21_20515 [Vibrio ponticus]